MPPFTTHYTQCCHPERIRSVSVTPKKNFTRVLYILPFLCFLCLLTSLPRMPSTPVPGAKPPTKISSKALLTV